MHVEHEATTTIGNKIVMIKLLRRYHKYLMAEAKIPVIWPSGTHIYFDQGVIGEALHNIDPDKWEWWGDSKGGDIDLDKLGNVLVVYKYLNAAGSLKDTKEYVEKTVGIHYDEEIYTKASLSLILVKYAGYVYEKMGLPNKYDLFNMRDSFDTNDCDEYEIISRILAGMSFKCSYKFIDEEAKLGLVDWSE